MLSKPTGKEVSEIIHLKILKYPEHVKLLFEPNQKGKKPLAQETDYPDHFYPAYYRCRCYRVSGIPDDL